MGPPDKQAKLADGTLVAEWLVNRGYTYAYGSSRSLWALLSPVT